MPIVRASYRPIPERLYHYTCGKAAFNIISGGSDDKICFWLKNAKSKNDAAEDATKSQISPEVFLKTA